VSRDPASRSTRWVQPAGIVTVPSEPPAQRRNPTPPAAGPAEHLEPLAGKWVERMSDQHRVRTHRGPGSCGGIRPVS
jgi:hypothetical protein